MGHVTHFELLPAPSGWVGNPQWRLRITKSDVAAYWNPGLPHSIDYALRLEADGEIHSPLSVVYGTMNASGPIANTVDTPSDLLMPAAPARGFYFKSYAPYLWNSLDPTVAGSAGDPVLWETRIESLFGGLMSISYHEVDALHIGDPAYEATEVWTYRQGTGIVSIEIWEANVHFFLRRIQP